MFVASKDDSVPLRFTPEEIDMIHLRPLSALFCDHLGITRVRPQIFLVDSEFVNCEAGREDRENNLKALVESVVASTKAAAAAEQQM